MVTMTRARLCSCPIFLGLALSLAAFAQTALTTQDVNVHAGPSKDYPLVAWLRPGTQVAVAGCLSTWTWCDVIVGPNRGWVYARYLAYLYQNQNVPIISGGAMLGLPIVTFSIVPYWDSYYRGRPWYGNRPHWQYRPPPSVRPPPPPPCDRSRHRREFGRRHSRSRPLEPGRRRNQNRHRKGRRLHDPIRRPAAGHLKERSL
jgi:uncharacterized protein YraI